MTADLLAEFRVFSPPKRCGFRVSALTNELCREKSLRISCNVITLIIFLMNIRVNLLLTIIFEMIVDEILHFKNSTTILLWCVAFVCGREVFGIRGTEIVCAYLFFVASSPRRRHRRGATATTISMGINVCVCVLSVLRLCRPAKVYVDVYRHLAVAGVEARRRSKRMEVRMKLGVQ